MATYTDIATIQAFDSSITAPSGTIQWAIDSVTQAIETYLDRTLSMTEYTEVFSGAGRPTVILSNYPVSGITSVTIDGTATTDHVVDDESGLLYYSDGTNYYRWPRGFRNITVTYTAGYSTTPADLAMVATQMTCDLLHSAGIKPGLKSETLADYSYATKDAMSAVTPYTPVLDAYRRTV